MVEWISHYSQRTTVNLYDYFLTTKYQNDTYAFFSSDSDIQLQVIFPFSTKNLVAIVFALVPLIFTLLNKISDSFILESETIIFTLSPAVNVPDVEDDLPHFMIFKPAKVLRLELLLYTCLYFYKNTSYKNLVILK